MTIPQDKKAEESVLGCILLDISNDAASVAFEMLIDTDFYHEKHIILFRACLELYNKHVAIDLVSVRSHLNSQNKLDAVGGDYFITGLLEPLPSAAHIEHYCELVISASTARRVQAICREAMSGINQNYKSYSEVAEKLDIELFKTMNRNHKNEMVPMGDLARQAMARIELAMDSSDGITGIKSGFSKLDWYTTGFQPGDFIILAARPSMGKTALALNIAVNAALRGDRIGFISIEMTDISLVNRVLVGLSGLDGQRVRMGRISQDELNRLADKTKIVSGLDLMISDKANTLAKIRSTTRRMVKRGAKMVIIDYLQLITHKIIGNENQKVTEISQAIKGIAKEFNIPIFALSQLSRPERSVQIKPPSLQDLRSSGSLEQDGDLIMFIHSQTGNEPGQAGEDRQLMISKHRNGPIGTIKMRFDSKTTTFSEVDEYHVEDYTESQANENLF